MTLCTFINVLATLCLYNAVSKAGSAFGKHYGFDPKELAVDLYYWFDKST